MHLQLHCRVLQCSVAHGTKGPAHDPLQMAPLADGKCMRAPYPLDLIIPLRFRPCAKDGTPLVGPMIAAGRRLPCLRYQGLPAYTSGLVSDLGQRNLVMLRPCLPCPTYNLRCLAYLSTGVPLPDPPPSQAAGRRTRAASTLLLAAPTRQTVGAGSGQTALWPSSVVEAPLPCRETQFPQPVMSSRLFQRQRSLMLVLLPAALLTAEPFVIQPKQSHCC